MSVRQSTRWGSGQPVGETANVAEVAPALGGDSVDAFRGYFLELVENGNVKDGTYLGTAYPWGTLSVGVQTKQDSGLSTFAVEPGGGLYGDDCLAVEYSHQAVTFDADSDRILCENHGFVNGDRVAFTAYDGDVDVVPGALWRNYLWDASEATNPWYVVNALEDSFQVSATAGGAAVSFIANHVNGSGQPFGVLDQRGMPSFWVGIIMSNGNGTGSFTNTGTDKFLGDVNRGPYNRFEYVRRNVAGYRNQFAAKTNAGVATSPYHEGTHVGTYHAAQNANSAEQWNYHFYYQLWPRWDLAGTDWIRHKLNESPSHQRGSNQLQPNNPVPRLLDDGGFWDTETRLYLDEKSYWRSPQVFGTNLKSYYDRFRIFYEEPPYDISVAWDTIDATFNLGLDPGDAPFEFPFTITNNESFEITGTIYSAYYYQMGAAVFNSLNQDITNTPTITLPASGTWQGKVKLTPSANPTPYVSGVVFTPTDQYNEDNNAATGVPNFSEPLLEQRWEGWTGGFDAHKWSAVHVWVWCNKYQVDFNTSTFNRTAHGLTNGTQRKVKLMNPGDSFPTNGTNPVFAEYVNYYVVNATADTLQLSASSGGAPITFVDNGVSSSGYFGIGTYS